MSSPFIYIIGAGGIVNDAHLPAYHWLVTRLRAFMISMWRGRKLLRIDLASSRCLIRWARLVAAAGTGVIYDIAVPADHLTQVLTVLPAGALVLMQKPMGMDYAQAKEILALASAKQLCSGCQLSTAVCPLSMQRVR